MKPNLFHELVQHLKFHNLGLLNFLNGSYESRLRVSRQKDLAKLSLSQYNAELKTIEYFRPLSGRFTVL